MGDVFGGWFIRDPGQNASCCVRYSAKPADAMTIEPPASSSRITTAPLVESVGRVDDRLTNVLQYSDSDLTTFFLLDRIICVCSRCTWITE